MSRPDILIKNGDIERIVNELLDALKGPRNLYQFGGRLVHTVRVEGKLSGITRSKGTPSIVAIPTPGLTEQCSSSARCFRIFIKENGEKKEVDVNPPSWAVAALEARGMWKTIRPLEAIVESPMLRHDGSVLQNKGHDDKTGLLYIPNGKYDPIAENPTKDDAIAAAERLLDLVCDYPFASRTETSQNCPDRSAWLASVLTPFARFAFQGPSPLNLIDANVRGAGKSKLADVVNAIVSGRPMPRMSPSQDDAEERKRITTLALSGATLVLIDNVQGPLGTAALDAALTAEEWQDRILGGNGLARLPLNITWYATGNNIQLVGDTSRRCLRIRLESPEERPEERTGFKYPDLVGYVRKNRNSLVADALTILCAFCQAKESPTIPPWGSFENWSDLVRKAIVWIDLEDPGKTRQELAAESDSAANALADLITGWDEAAVQFGGKCSASQILGLIAHNDANVRDEGIRYKTLRDALAELCPTAPGKLPSARQLSTILGRYRGRVVGGKALMRPKEHTEKGALWTVRTVKTYDQPKEEKTNGAAKILDDDSLTEDRPALRLVGEI